LSILYKMNRVTFEADRWFLRAYSPQPFEELPVANQVAVIHPGWARHPSSYLSLMLELETAGIFPIAVDTRYGYANRFPIKQSPSATSLPKIMLQPYDVGNNNRLIPEATKIDNRGALRKATATLAICEALGVKEFHLLGHSDGGRTATAVVEVAPSQVQSLTLVNAVGIGKTPDAKSYIDSRTFKRVAEERIELLREGLTTRDLVIGGLSSALYAITHPRRVALEYTTIRSADTWAVLERLAEDTPVHVLQAKNDPLIDYADALSKATEHPNIQFTSTEGAHNNFYNHAVQELIVRTLTTPIN